MQNRHRDELADRIAAKLFREQDEWTRQQRQTTHPSKRSAKRAAKYTPTDRVFSYGCGPGSSRSVLLDAIKAIGSESTGCVVVDSGRGSIAPKSTTDRNVGNIIGGRDRLA